MECDLNLCENEVCSGYLILSDTAHVKGFIVESHVYCGWYEVTGFELEMQEYSG